MNKKEQDKMLEDLNKDMCSHCQLEGNLRAYISVMADEPDALIKLSEIYRNLKMMLGDTDG